MSLLDVFLELNIPQTENSKLFNAKALDNFPFAKIGINFLGFPVILISSKFDQTHLSLKNIKLKYIELTHNLECKVSENGQSKIDNYSVIVFKSNEDILQNYFLGIATSLLNSLSKKPTQKEVFETFKNFIEIFRSLTETPTKTIQGLWAELILIEQSKNPETLINYWHNIPEEKFDFNAGTERIEVKSSSNFERRHIFSTGQLNPPSDTQVLIASIFLKQHNSGNSIQQLIDRISEKINYNIEAIEKLSTVVFRTLGNSLEHSIRVKFDYEIAQQSLRFYRHQDIQKIEEINIPRGVSEVKFTSDLNGINPVFLNNLKDKKTLFKSL